MPYKLTYVPAEIFLEYKGVTVYHVYKDNDPDQGTREAWFDINENSSDDDGFYLPHLEAKLAEMGVTFYTQNSDADEQDKISMRLAIDSGILRSKRNRSRKADPRASPSQGPENGQ